MTLDKMDGYVDGIDYPYVYYPPINPLRLRLSFLNVGLKPPAISTACELGFGRGLSLAVHAAASSAYWYGTDINFDHVKSARQLAAVAGADVAVYNDAFVDFTDRPDLPAFDFVAVHGVWSWVSDANRRTIVDFVRRKLKPNGVLFISYNSTVGWAGFSPLRQLLVECAASIDSSNGGIPNRIGDAVDFVKKLLAVSPDYARHSPEIVRHLENLQNSDRRLVAHEYFNQDWVLMDFTAISRWLSPANVRFACSANSADHNTGLRLTAAQRNLLAEIRDEGVRESTRDFIVNRRYRYEYWAKGAHRISVSQRDEILRGERVIYATHLRELPFSIRAALALNGGGMDEAVCSTILDLLADRKSRSLGEIEHAVQSKGISLSKVLEVVMLLADLGYIFAAQDDAETARARPCTDKLNAFLMGESQAEGVIEFLASPVTGGGVSVGYIQQLFLRAIRQGKTRPEEWAGEASKVISTKGTTADLADLANMFADEELPTLRALQVV